MTKRSPEFFAELVAAIAETGSIAAAAKVCRCSVSAVWGWIASSAKGEPGFNVEWMGETVPLHQAVKQAQRLVSATILDNFRNRLLRGTDEIARFQGRTVYRRDPALDHLSDRDLEDLGIATRYLKDADGNFIPEMIHQEPPIQGVLALLAADFPKQFGSRQTIEVNSRSSGVQVVKHQYAQPKPLPVSVQEVAPVAAIEAPIVDVEPEDLSDILGEPESAEPGPVVEAVAPPPAEPRTPPPVADSVTPQPAEPAKALSSLQRDLLDRLARRAGADRASAIMAPPIGRPEPDDVDPRRTGAGGPPPGATKVV